jgi:hypothetical protein
MPLPSLYAQQHETGLQMRILIYLLAMLTGFSAAEAARPVPSASPAVDTAIARTYAAISVKNVEQIQSGPVLKATRFATPSNYPSLIALFAVFDADSPVLRHDVILG